MEALWRQFGGGTVGLVQKFLSWAEPGEAKFPTWIKMVPMGS